MDEISRSAGGSMLSHKVERLLCGYPGALEQAIPEEVQSPTLYRVGGIVSSSLFSLMAGFRGNPYSQLVAAKPILMMWYCTVHKCSGPFLLKLYLLRYEA